MASGEEGWVELSMLVRVLVRESATAHRTWFQDSREGRSRGQSSVATKGALCGVSAERREEGNGNGVRGKKGKCYSNV